MKSSLVSALIIASLINLCSAHVREFYMIDECMKDALPDFKAITVSKEIKKADSILIQLAASPATMEDLRGAILEKFTDDEQASLIGAASDLSTRMNEIGEDHPCLEIVWKALGDGSAESFIERNYPEVFKMDQYVALAHLLVGRE